MGMPETRRFLSASLVGLAATATDVVLLALLYRLGWVVGAAAFTGSMAGAVVGFVANKYWALRDGRPLTLRQVAIYTAVSITTALLTAAAMHLGCDRGHLPYLFAKLASAALVFALWTYPAQRRLVFV
jgi:putative flippase GtrA